MRFLLYMAMLLSTVVLSAQDSYELPTIGNLSFTACNGTLYDSGGADGDYQNNESGSVTFSDPDADFFELTFTYFDVETFFDEVLVYAGDATSGTLVGSYTGNELPNNGAPIAVASNTVTVVFNSDFTIVRSGFELDFSCGTVDNPPVAFFNAPASTCSGNAGFQDQSTGFATSWTWDFGDGTTSTEQNPTHQYTTPGTYDVSLTACNSAGCNTLISTGAITYDPDTELCANGVSMPEFGEAFSTECQGVLFDPGGVDGDYASYTHSSFIIQPPGASSISITFSEFNLGDDGEHTDVLYIYDATNFTTLGVYQGNTLPGDGQTLVFNVPAVTVILSTNFQNNYSGFVLEWLANGSTEPPVASFTSSTENTPLGVPVQFTDTSENGPGQWSWDFGDGSTSEIQNPFHIYTTPGTYTITLTVTNCIGSDVATQTITVQDPPALSFDPGSFDVTLDAGTTGSETLTICNNGVGDLVFGATSQNDGTTGSLSFTFTTNENGADFSWALLDENFEVLQEGSGYDAFETVDLNFTNLDLFGSYYLGAYSPEGVQPIETFIWYDADGNILYEDGLATGPEMIYFLPPPFESPAATWLALDANNGELAAGECMTINLTFDATELIGGVYETVINLLSNDPAQSAVSLPVTLTVIGTPAIAISTNNLDFGDVQVGATPQLSFVVENTGTDVLTIGNLVSDEAVFSLSDGPDLSLEPGASRTIEVTFAPTAIQAYNTTLTLTNNAGDDQLVTITGNGIAAPSLTIDPLAFSAELIAGETATFTVNIGNVGEAPLDYSVTTGGDNTGFELVFTTDNWGFEFSWVLLNGNGDVVQSSEGTNYQALTTYTELLTGLSTDETYALLFIDSFGDGALTDYSVTDLGSSTVIATGSFLNPGFELNVPLGSPTENTLDVTPTEGTLQVNENGQLSIFADSEGLSTGTYQYTVFLATNDPTQPLVPISVTLFVIAPVEVDFAASPTQVCGNLPVQFTDLTENVATSWEWVFGDGTTSTEQNPSHQYTADGTYTVTLTACNSLGCQTETKTDYISVELDCFTQNIPPAYQTEVVTVCTGNVYDSGGPAGDYLEGNFGTLIIAPPGATQVSITFSEFNYEEHADFLYVYDGDISNGNATLLGAYTGNDLLGQTLVANSGVLSLQEYTGHFVQLSGFVATFSCDDEPQPPFANFIPNEDLLCTGEARLFNDLSAGNIATWLWDFGDGSTSALQNPAHVYQESGTYTVSLTVCNDIGCDTEVQEVDIEINPDCGIENVPNYEVTYITNCSGVIFDSGGENGNYLDNNYGAVTLIRPGGGIFLTFTEFDFVAGDMVLIFDGLDPNGDLLAAYDSNNPPVLNETISYSSTAITIVEYTDFADNAAGFRLEYSCPAFGPGDENDLQVFNGDMCDGTRTFRTNPDLGYNSWTWNFGDGHTSTEAEPEHTYDGPGMYEVSVEACLDGECDTYAVMLYSNKLVPAIDAPEQAYVGEEVQFAGLTETATHWNWDFGNGETITHDAPTTMYTAPGSYEVHVHLINMNVHETCDATHVHEINVLADPTSVSDLETVKVQLFPNPTTDRVQVRWDTQVAQATDLRVYDTAGRLLLDTPPTNELDLTGLAAGTYVVELRFEKYQPVRQRIVKQ